MGNVIRATDRFTMGVSAWTDTLCSHTTSEETWPILGIDPGVNGAAALVWPNGNIMVQDMPCHKEYVGSSWRSRIDTSELVTILHVMEFFAPVAAFVEQVHGRPGFQSSKIGVLCHSAGLVEGILNAFKIPVHLVPPHVWKGRMSLNSDKGKSRETAAKLFPDNADLFKRVKDDGRAEAALIAMYGLRLLRDVPLDRNNRTRKKNH